MIDFDVDEQAMLGLAALAYRGLGETNEQDIRDKLVSWLPKMDEAGLGRWQLVWGPASFRAPPTLLDDAMAYVARDLEADHPRYAVAIRGTNPISLFDWVVGDLWVDRLEAWPYGRRNDNEEPEISMSSLIGLRILQSLRSEPEPKGRVGGLWRWFLRRIRRQTNEGISAIATALQEAAAAGDHILPDLEWRTALRDPDRFDLEQRLALLGNLDDLRRGWLDAVRPVHPAELDTTLSLQDEADRVVLEGVLAALKLASANDRGVSLESFLRTEIASVEGAEIVVTGHSKGGALANVVALWLADTQGSDGGWDPDAKATVACYSYAGPTPGNADFAKRYDAVLGERSRRIANRRDVVPHAWNAGDMREIKDLYGPGTVPDQLLEMVDGLATHLERRRYTHVAVEREFDPGVDDQNHFVQQVIHHHIDAYLVAVAPTLPFNCVGLILDP